MDRQQALKLWDESMDELSKAFKAYTQRTDALFTALSKADDAGTALQTPNWEDALQHVDKRLSDLQEFESVFHNTRIALQGIRNESTVLSPVGRLPPEIISYIITIGDDEDQSIRDEQDRVIEEADSEYDEDDNEVIPEVPFIPHFPTLFSHVCSRWRRIALENPSVWRRITFSEGPPFERAQAWLERSKASDLEVVIDFDDERTHLTESEVVESMLALLRPHAQRITTLYIRAENLAEVPNILFSLMEDNKPLRVKNLALLTNDAEGPMNLESYAGKLTPLKSTLLGVRELRVDHVPLPWGYVTLKGLKVLRLEYLNVADAPTASQLHEVLSASPELEFLEIYGVDIIGLEDDRGDSAPSHPRVVLPHLREVRLGQLDAAPANFALSILEAPNATIVRLSDLFLPSRDRGVMVDFFRRISESSLKRLRIENCSFSDTDFIHILEENHHIWELHFIECEGVGAKLLKWLGGKNSKIPCQELTTLKIDGLDHENFFVDDLKSFVEARIAANKPLRSISVKYCTPDAELEPWLRARIADVTFIPIEEGGFDDEDMTTDGEDLDMVDIDMDTWNGIED